MRVEIPYDWVLSKLELVHILKHFWKLTRLLFHSILIEKYRPGCVVTYRSGHLTMGEIIWYSNGWKSHQNHRKKKNTPFAVCGNPPGYHLLMTVGLEPTKMTHAVSGSRILSLTWIKAVMIKLLRPSVTCKKWHSLDLRKYFYFRSMLFI